MKAAAVTVPLFVVLFALSASAQEKSKGEPSKGESKDPNIRPAGEVVLKFERKIEIPEIKRFDDKGVLELFPGDKVHLEFADDGKGGLTQPKVVAKVRDPAKTITFAMKQDKQMTTLTRSTKIQKTVGLDCVHRGLGGENFHRTNLHPTEKGLMAFDTWPNTVWILRLSNIKVTSKSAAEVYDEKVSRDEPDKSKADDSPADQKTNEGDPGE